MFVNVSLVVVLHNTSPASLGNTGVCPMGGEPWSLGLDLRGLHKQGGVKMGSRGSQKYLQMSKP